MKGYGVNNVECGCLEINHPEFLLKFWGKTERNAQDASVFHPALFHILDVAHVAGILLDERCSQRWRNVLSGLFAVDPIELQKFIPFYVALHDIGKFSAAFQRQDPLQHQRLLKEGLTFGRSQDIPHAQVSRHFIWHEWPDLSLAAVSDKHRLILRETVVGHHGIFAAAADIGDVKMKLKFEEPNTWKTFRSDVFQLLASLLLDTSLTSLPDPQNVSSAVMELTGFTTLCDWIGSDQRFFTPHPDRSLDVYIAISKECALKAVESDGFSAFTFSSVPTTFSGLFNGLPEPRPLQIAVDDIPPSLLEEPCLVVIEAPTGEGKTEAALAVAHRIAARRNSDEFYYALPTMATSNQMHLRIQKYLHDQLKLGVGAKLVHGQAFLAQDLVPVNPMTNGEGGLDVGHAADWFNSKKKALLAPFGVGTIDQVELGVLNVRHSSLRLAGLSGKVVILDEVHAYDTYMTTIVTRLLNWLNTLGASVILLSATLPASRRKELVRTYSHDDNAFDETEAYPLITIVNSSAVVSLMPPAAQSSKEIGLNLLHFRDDEVDKKADWLIERVNEGGCICWITNTVDRAQAMYAALLDECDQETDLALLHARFPLFQREDLETGIARKIGPEKSHRPKKMIVIGTQVLEQSLDLDFDLMVTDLAPVDLLLQRAGRLHRHSTTQYRGQHHQPALYVNIPLMGQQPDIHIDRVIYHEYFLLRTWQEIRQMTHISLPADYRRLVEAVYTPPAGEIDEELGKAYARLLKDEELARQEAELRLLPQPDPESSFTSLAARMVFEESETRAGWIVAQTRLGEKSINLVPLEDHGDHYTIPGDEEPIWKDQPVDSADQLRMLRAQVRVSRAEVVDALSHQIDNRNLIFSNSQLLRDVHPLWLTDGKAEVETTNGIILLELDPLLGLMIKKKGG
jgi:CRISPR-associated endonuclease/helicase Cas3